MDKYLHSEQVHINTRSRQSQNQSKSSIRLISDMCHIINTLFNVASTLSYLKEHKFNHNFQNCINPLCTCSLEVESTVHFFWHCHNYHSIRAKLLNSIELTDTNRLKLSE